MKRVFLVLLLFCSSLFSHSLVMNLYDNNDNTITVIGEFSTGEEATGALVKVESLISGEILFQQRLPKESELTIDIPKEPYQVVLDGGEGHTIVKDGIAPKEGFSKQLSDKEKDVVVKITEKKVEKIWGISSGTGVFFGICIVLFILAIYFGFYNTNRILREVRKEENRE
ncbi:hypothetical protein [Aliarcobacter lanthieri]|uniref:hypothetical protein n=1 Tax=Aliarcobacter lanthieri TaxID=1355374 RepID=UPI003AAF7E71